MLHNFQYFYKSDTVNEIANHVAFSVIIRMTVTVSNVQGKIATIILASKIMDILGQVLCK
jgi:hypothetical protein